MLRRFLGRRWSAGYAIAGLVFLGATIRLFVSPSAVAIDDLEPADAVVMFAGGTGERLDAVFAVMEQDVADTLVLPNGTVPGWRRGNRLCSGEADVDFRVICPDPHPDNTRGEAQTIARIAAEEGWDSIISVTSNYHVVRADLRLSRCFDGRIQRVSAGHNRSRGAALSLIGHEWLGLVQARVFQRGC